VGFEAGFVVDGTIEAAIRPVEGSNSKPTSETSTVGLDTATGLTLTARCARGDWILSMRAAVSAKEEEPIKLLSISPMPVADFFVISQA
jgi:hypothetical protein